MNVTSIQYNVGEDGKAVKVNCYFINYKIFVNIVKYKLDMMRKKMEVEERDATSRYKKVPRINFFLIQILRNNDLGHENVFKIC